MRDHIEVLRGLVERLPTSDVLDAVDDDQKSGTRPCPVVFTIAEVRGVRAALAALSAQPEAPAGMRELADELYALAKSREFLDQRVSLNEIYAHVEKLRALAHLAQQAEAQAGGAVAWSVLEIGARGSAYDLPDTRRAFTYEHQPGNLIASRIGGAAYAAEKESAGDSIDKGLGLLMALQEAGFGVFQIGPAITTPPPGAVLDGWKLVPVEPTLDMENAWGQHYGNTFKGRYSAMLAAAPGPKENT